MPYKRTKGNSRYQPIPDFHQSKNLTNDTLNVSITFPIEFTLKSISIF
ncbi:hypothetical protein THF1C08_110041 [Vibrio jasicida]|uniref:Uncharacterized protein n=1 Tax=Vibrio jasicida TaxID=766224 RepID=A0AAU9QGJ2_9VIBR|nr:hypothetical protein THF1C08_110041 [Vibrio jasicida]CAH1568607.1 hypothetical protein THF1A12_100042 [Vibrio jasicida]